MKASRDLWIAPAGEGLLILVAALFGWAVSQPFIFASLGPTAYELVEQADKPSARPYNVIVGHGIGVLAGLLGVWVTHAAALSTSAVHAVPFARVWAALIACAVTAFFVLFAKASQPAALATALVVALGTMRPSLAGFDVMIGVLVVTAVGEPIRRAQIRARRRRAT